MRAIIIEELGGTEVMKFVEHPDPEPQPGHVVVQVAAAGVNFMDIYQRQGVGGYKPAEFPVVQGAEGAGTVTAVAPDVTELSVGDRVAWAGVPRSYAEQAVIPAARAVPVPDGVSLDIAAAVMLQGITAHYLCVSTYPVREGDVTVVHAAAGGVGLLLTQMIKRRGGVVVATTSGGAGGEKSALAREAGAGRPGLEERQRGAQAGPLERLAFFQLIGDREPVQRAVVGAPAAEAGERLVGVDAPGAQVDDRLDDHPQAVAGDQAGERGAGAGDLGLAR